MHYARIIIRSRFEDVFGLYYITSFICNSRVAPFQFHSTSRRNVIIQKDQKKRTHAKTLLRVMIIIYLFFFLSLDKNVGKYFIGRRI